jgi:hypothetical protein
MFMFIQILDSERVWIPALVHHARNYGGAEAAAPKLRTTLVIRISALASQKSNGGLIYAY